MLNLRSILATAATVCLSFGASASNYGPWNTDQYTSLNPHPFESKVGLSFARYTRKFKILTPEEVYCNSGLSPLECIQGIVEAGEVVSNKCRRSIRISLTKGHRQAGFPAVSDEIGYLDFNFDLSSTDRRADLSLQLKAICE